VAVPESCACAENETASTTHVNKAVLTAMGSLLGFKSKWRSQNYFVTSK
jgi:hypothetical protein